MRSLAFAAAALVILALPVSAAAQAARATGTVRDTNGRPIKGATIRAMNPDAAPREFTAVSDDKGRFAMIGLRTGTWTLRVEAEGFDPVEASSQMRVAGTPPLAFTLQRALAPIPNALAPDVQQQLAAARELREAGRLDQALSAYQEIRTKNPKLTTVNLVLADVYRKKAAQERDPAARQALLDRAIESYTAVLAADAAHERAKAELESTRAEVAAAR
jgi:tetratricopeptide (TPR) repeat protein